MTNLEACLPEQLRALATTITPIAAGLSGAAVYRVDAAGQTFVLKISNEPLASWRQKLHIQQLAAGAGLAPVIVHVDNDRRAVVSAFVVDRSFPALVGNPRTRDAAIAQLGRTLRRVHDLPLPPDAEQRDTLAMLGAIWSGLARVPVPAFVTDAVERLRAEVVPPAGRASVLSHNDVNPTNLVYDGAELLLIDWDTAGLNDPFYDLAAVSVFLRLDEATCRVLLAAHDGDGAPVAALPARFAYDRRLVAVACGVIFLHLARHGGHLGEASSTLDATASLAELFVQMRAGSFSVATADGQWALGLALVKESVAL